MREAARIKILLVESGRAMGGTERVVWELATRLPTARFEVRAGRTRSGTDRPGCEAGPGPVGDQVVGWRTDDCDVDPLEVRGLLGER